MVITISQLNAASPSGHINSEFLELDKYPSDTAKINYLLEKCDTYSYRNIDTFNFIAELTENNISLLSKNTSDKRKLNKMLIRLWITCGDAYVNLGMAENGLNYYNQAKKLSEKLNDYDLFGKIWNQIGLISYQQELYKMALTQMNNSYSSYKKAQSNSGMAMALNNKGALYDALGNFDSAKIYYEKSLYYRVKARDTVGEITTLLNLGVLNGIKGTDQELVYYQKGLSLAHFVNYKKGLAFGYHCLGSYYLSAKNKELALVYADSAYQIAISINDAEEAKYAVQLLEKVYFKLGKWKESREKYEEYIELRDSLTNIENQKSVLIQETKHKFEIEKIELENKIKNEKNIADERHYSDQLKAILLIVCFSFIIIVIVIVFRRIKIKRDLKVKEQEEKNRQLIELDSFKKNMYAMVVHDLKNPLNIILGMTAKEEVRSAAMQMNRLVMNILDTQKFEETKIILNRENISIAKLIQSSISQVEFMARSKNINIIVEYNEDYFVSIDIELMKRVVVNLLTNAIKFTSNGRKIIIHYFMNDLNEIQIEVIDEGKGIPKDLQSRVFERFQSYSKSTQNTNTILQSTGIGLTFCKMVIEAHGGKINVSSEIDKGSKFFFTIEKANLPSLSNNTKKEQSAEQFILTNEDKTYLAPFYTQLKSLEVYYLSDIKQTLEKIDDKTSTNVKNWKSEIEKAVLHCDAELYNYLLNCIQISD